MYVVNPRLRELLMRRMGSYIRYLRHADDSGLTGANLHLVYSADPELDGRRAAWADATAGAFVSYQGHGRHTDMLLPPHLDENARLLLSILDSLARKKSLGRPSDRLRVRSETGRRSAGNGAGEGETVAPADLTEYMHLLNLSWLRRREWPWTLWFKMSVLAFACC